MKVLTLNTWQERGPWRERWERILRGLAECRPDIVAFQEVFNMDWAREVRERSGYPYLAVSGQHSGLVFLSKFKPVEQECLVLQTRSPTEWYLRYAFYVRVDMAGKEIAFFNTHLSWRADEEDVRMKQTLELEAFIDKKSTRLSERAGRLPAAVMGDLNGAPETLPVRHLREVRHWIDTFEAANPWVKEEIPRQSSGSSAHSGLPLAAVKSLRSATPRAYLTWDYRNPYAEAERKKMAERRIDYIFVRELAGPFAKIKSSAVVFDQPSPAGVYPSDHFGVLTEFSEKQ